MKFLKEYFTLIFIIIFVLGIDFFTSNTTEKLAKEVNEKIDSIIEYSNQNYNKNEMLKKVEKFENDWKNTEEKLSFFAEHNELEKVTTDIVSLKSNIIMENKQDAFEKMKQIKFKTEHIKNKQKFKLNNIF